jgi:hypothetical protein
MNKQEAKILREELNKVCKLFDTDYSVEVGNATFNNYDVTFKVTIASKDTLPKEERDLQEYASLYELNTNKIVQLHDGKYSLVGFNSNARKKPFIIQKLPNGSKYVIDLDQAQKLFSMGL